MRRFLPNILLFVLGVLTLVGAVLVNELLPLSVILLALSIAWGADGEGRYYLLASPRTVFFGVSCLLLIGILYAATTLHTGLSGIGAVVFGLILLMIAAAEAAMCLVLRLIYRIAKKQKFAPRAVPVRDWILFGIDAAAALTLFVIWMELV